ncbi:MAG TPA: TlpA disulfide reductase family protein [Planctomycetaceae bacterium]|nr:TlpA disulfide reductase family protein [Planctomycetaceae bacterium]
MRTNAAANRVRFFGHLASIALAIAAAVLTGGCTQSPPATGLPLNPPKGSTAPLAVPAPTVEILSWDQTQKRREEFHGKVVVLDVWSTYCDPCVREFPNLVALQKRFGDKVRCISFDTDYSGAEREPADSFRKPVLAFLSKQGAAGLLNVICSDPSEDFYNKIRLGGPPAVFVYDPSGKLVKRFDNSQVPKTPEFTYERDIVPLVEKLLATGRS